MGSGRLRLLAAGSLAIVVALGVWAAFALGPEPEAQGDDPKPRERAVVDGEPVEPIDETEFEASVTLDAERLDAVVPTLEQLRQPNAHHLEIKDAIVLTPGRTWKSKWIRIRAAHDKVTYRKHGATISARHSLAYVTNVGTRPVGYYLRITSDGARCEVRGARMHNAMALMPDETAEIVVCAGGGNVRVEHLELLEVTELGYHYLSQLPPGAVGHDPITGQSHRPVANVPQCSGFDSRALAQMIRAGTTRWKDVADFFSRHSCERFVFPAQYRYAEAPIPRLPALSQGS